MIETVERFYCPLCGFLTFSLTTIEIVKKTGKCPACDNGKPKVWKDKKPNGPLPHDWNSSVPLGRNSKED